MRRSFWVVLTAALLVTACSSTPAAKLASAPAERPTPTETDPAPADTFPLTGEPTDDPREDQPIVAVKIENTSAARPQAGLEAADLVFEQLVEGGLTRFAVLFHSELPTDVGPVRSARFVDIDILGSLGSALVYSGARQEVTDALWQQRLIALIADSGRPIFRRAPDRPGSHDLMADLEAALALAVTLPQVTPAPRFLEFGPAPDGGAPGTEVTIRLSGAARTGWQWDAEAAVYRRFQNEQPQVVTGDGQVGAANVVAIGTDVGTGGCCDTAGNPFTVTRFTGDGPAVIWRDGLRFEARWVKPSATAHLSLTTTDGQPFPLAPGPTWFHLARPDAIPSVEETPTG
jgi:hypothetical protein